MEKGKLYKLQETTRKPVGYEYKLETTHNYSRGKYGTMNMDIGVPTTNLQYTPCILLRMGTKGGYIVLRFTSGGEIVSFFDEIITIVQKNGFDIQEALEKVKAETAEIKQLKASKHSARIADKPLVKFSKGG